MQIRARSKGQYFYIVIQKYLCIQTLRYVGRLKEKF
jgi:hypothetical protein